jgi:hypothetical protein
VGLALRIREAVIGEEAGQVQGLEPLELRANADGDQLSELNRIHLLAEELLAEFRRDRTR